MVRYTGDGNEYIYGVPMRDMTDDEWNALPEDGRVIAIASGLFEPEIDNETEPESVDDEE